MATLGYAVAEWLTDVLPSPGDSASPFVLTDEQVGFLLGWYAIDDRGRFLFRRGSLQMPKGWGKSPLAAAIAIAEFAGPVTFDGFGADGRSVGRPWGTGGLPPAWVQIAAGSESQASSNVYSLVWEFLTVNEGAAAEKLGIDQGRTRLYLKSSPGAKLEAVTSEAGSREGQRTTFVVLDETHLWTKQSGGLRLARTIRRNAAKMAGRVLECSNAHELGAGSVAESTAEAHEAGEPGILYVANRPTREPSPEMSDSELLGLLREVYGDARWVDLDRILAEVRDPAAPWDESSRYFFNLPGSGAAAFVDPARWAELASGDNPEEGSRVALGFLGASADSAALVLCSLNGRLSSLDVWEGTIPRSEVARAVLWAFGRFDVGAFYIDPRGWRSEAEEWAETYGAGVVLEFPGNSPRRMAPALDRFRVAVAEGTLRHDGDPDLGRHIANARVRAGRSGHMIEEAAPGRPIDAAIAAVLAHEAAAHIPEAKEILVAWE